MRFWIELGADNIAYRQIVLDNQGKYSISCRDDCLAEEPVDESSLEGNIISISQNEFEESGTKQN